MKRCISILAAVSLLSLQGCSAFKSATQTVNIQCSEQGTTIMVNGQNRPCPVQIEARRNRDLSIQAHKPGYVPYMRTIGHHMSTTGTLDAVGTLLILLPGVGLFTPGAWDLDETDIAIQLWPNAAQTTSPITAAVAPVEGSPVK